MIVVLGITGYIGRAFAQALRERGWPYIGLSRRHLDYTRFDVLTRYLDDHRPQFLINVAGYTGKPNVDACETAQADTLAGNTLLPMTVAQACTAVGIPYGHVSSGCIFAGARIGQDGQLTVERDLTRPDLRALADEHPESIHGFTELDTPNFTFRSPPCSFYSGSKALGEEAIAGLGHGYIWRLRIPFDEFDNPRNYLTKLLRYPRLYDNVNSISHRAEFAQACLELWGRRAPFGIYNVTNPGFVTTRQVADAIQRVLKPGHPFEFWASDEEFYRLGAKTPRSNCVMDCSKLLAAGVSIRPVEQALNESLERWQWQAQS